MRRRGKIQALLAVLMIVAMMIGSIPMDIVSVQAEEEPAEITAFDEPEIEIAVEVGTKLEDISFPETLKAQIKGGESKDVPVTWEDAGQYNMDIAGTYPFVVKLGADYTYAGTLPEVKVTVAEAEPQPEAAEETEAQTETPTQTPAVEEAEANAAETEAEPVEYQNKISGFVWADKVLDGNYDPDAEDENNREWAIEGYKVYLLKADDQSVVAETTTDAEGKYELTNIEPGSYVVQPHYNTPDTGDYRRSRLGIVGQNMIEAATGATAVLDILADSVIENQDIGMKVKPGFQLKANATYTINIGSPNISGIPGVTYAGNVLTFTSADPTDTYIITGTTTTNSIDINSGVTVKITLRGVNMQKATSPIRIFGTANIMLDGTNILQCTGNAVAYGYCAGLYVPSGAVLAIDEVSSGGELTASTSVRTGAGIGGSSMGSYTTHNSGTIIINGGTVTATACIDSVGNGSAGIGGGMGGNNGTVIINGGMVTATGAAGAGIGGGWGLYYSGHNYITGGGGGYTEINGGMVVATSAYSGAGIGGGAVTGGINFTNQNDGGVIKITGGTVVASGGKGGGIGSGGAGIGGGGGGDTTKAKAAVSVEIGAAADVKAYSMASTRPAIWANSSIGTGYYFNGYLTSGPLSYVATLDVCPQGSISPTKTLSLPANYLSFAYSTGGASATNNILVYNNSNMEGVIVYTANNDWNIVSNIAYTTLQQVKFSPFAMGVLSHSNVTDSTADLTNTGHSFGAGTMDAATAFQYNHTNVFTSSADYTAKYWTAPGASPYTATLTGLDSNTMHYYRAYVANQYLGLNSNVQKFLTLPKIDDSKWRVTTTHNSASIKGDTGSIIASKNSQSITGVTVYFNTTNNFSGATPYVLASSEYTDTTFDYNLPSSLVSTLTMGTTYYVWVVASNATGTMGGDSKESMKTFQLGYSVTEKFEKFGGGRVDNVGLSDNTVTVTGGSYTASGIPTSYTTGGDTYAYLGYKFDSYSPGDTLSSGMPSAVTITGNRDVYYVYGLLVDVGISKTVTGSYGDPNKAFEVTITLEDSSGTPVTGTYAYMGSAISGVTAPANGSITFNGSGQGIINLKHGQTIMFKGIPQSYTYTVKETDATVSSGIYDVTYSGTGTVSGSGASAVIAQTLGTTAATVSITNNRSTVPASGIKGSNYQMASVGILGALVVVALMFFSYRRRRKCR